MSRHLSRSAAQHGVTHAAVPATGRSGHGIGILPLPPPLLSHRRLPHLLLPQVPSPSIHTPNAASLSSPLHHPFSPHLPHGLSLNSDFIVSHALGSYVYSTSSRAYLDFTCGIGVTNLGHCHPRVQRAVAEQMQKGAHLQVNCYTSQPLLTLASKLASILPPNFPPHQVLFSNSGAEAIENAVKLSRVATGRQTVIVFQGGFHGRTIGAGSLTTAKYVYRTGFQPTMAGVHVAPFPYCHRCPVAEASSGCYSAEHCCNDPLRQLQVLLKTQTGPSEVAAVIIEPVLGEGGYVPAPPGFLPAVRRLCSDIGAMMVVDEVQSGYGRTGTVFNIEQHGVVPDIIVTAKGIANGYPLSAIIAPATVLAKAGPGSIGGTYGGNAVSCAAGIAVIDALKEDGVLENVKARGEQLRAGLRELKGRGYPVADVRGPGLMVGLEFDREVKAGTAAAVTKAALQEGLLLLTSGIYESIRFIPPLTISDEEMKEGLEKFERALEKIFNKK